jgi:hypothetical protein
MSWFSGGGAPEILSGVAELARQPVMDNPVVLNAG